MNPQKTETPFTSEVLEEVLSYVQTEIVRLKRVFSNEVYYHTGNETFERFVQTHQIGLIDLLDTLSGVIDLTDNILKKNSIPVPKELSGVQKTVYIIIEDLLSYLGYRYCRYCNRNIKISQKYRCLFLCKLEKEIVEIETAELKISPELLAITLTPVKTRLENTKTRWTYSMVLFYKELLRVTNDIKKIRNKDEHEDELIRSLIFINFNSVYFARYCVKKIKSGLEHRHTVGDKIEFLALCLKKINQTAIRRHMALLNNYPPVKEFLSQWLLAEIFYWERKLQLLSPFKNEKKFLVDTNIKIATDLSVPQLACFVRLLVETGIFTNARKEDILEFFPGHYKTKKCESIEYGSFRSKYYAISDPTKEHIRNLIITMLNELRNL